MFFLVISLSLDRAEICPALEKGSVAQCTTSEAGCTTACNGDGSGDGSAPNTDGGDCNLSAAGQRSTEGGMLRLDISV